MGVVYDVVIWPEDAKRSWRMLGNTWPVHVVSQILKPIIDELLGDANDEHHWLGGTRWEKTEYALGLWRRI